MKSLFSTDIPLTICRQPETASCLNFCHLEEKGAAPNSCSPKIASMRNNKEYNVAHTLQIRKLLFLKISLAAAKWSFPFQTDLSINLT